jgi:hypothetical protein
MNRIAPHLHVLFFCLVATLAVAQTNTLKNPADSARLLARVGVIHQHAYVLVRNSAYCWGINPMVRLREYPITCWQLLSRSLVKNTNEGESSLRHGE